MKTIELVNDYHRVLRIMKNYNPDEAERLIRGLQGYVNLMRSEESETTPVELNPEGVGLTEAGADVDIAEPERAAVAH